MQTHLLRSAQHEVFVCDFFFSSFRSPTSVNRFIHRRKRFSAEKSLTKKRKKNLSIFGHLFVCFRLFYVIWRSARSVVPINFCFCSFLVFCLGFPSNIDRFLVWSMVIHRGWLCLANYLSIFKSHLNLQQRVVNKEDKDDEMLLLQHALSTYIVCRCFNLSVSSIRVTPWRKKQLIKISNSQSLCPFLLINVKPSTSTDYRLTKFEALTRSSRHFFGKQIYDFSSHFSQAATDRNKNQ